MNRLIGLTLFVLIVSICVDSLVGQESDGIFGNVVEGFVKDLFKKEMKTVDTANMTDCMTRLLCEQICQRTASGQISQPLIDSQEIMGKDKTLPENMPYFFAGGDHGFEYGQTKKCDKCAQQYPCSQQHYQSALDMTNDYINRYNH